MADRNAEIVINLRSNADAETRRMASSFRALIGELRSAGASQEAAERKALSHAQALAQLAVRSGNATQGQRILAAAISQVDQQSTAAVRAETQLVAIQQRASQGASGFAGALGSVKDALGAAGIVLGAKQLIDFGVEAGKAALSLEHTEAAVRQVAGSQSQYNEIVDQARRQQLLFGGSLQENLDQLSSFAVQSRRTGASLQELITTAQRLSTLDPEQGIRGASIALNEALSGDPTSLARRFEIPGAELAKLRDESSTTAEKLKIISAVLDKAGISADAVTKATTDTEKTYNQLGASLDDAKTHFGSFLAHGLEPAARGLDRLTRLALGSRDAIIEFRQSLIGQDAGTARQNTIANEIDAAISRAAAARGAAAGGEAFSDPATGIVVQTTAAADASQNLVAVLTPLRQRMIDVSVASDASAASVQGAVSQLVAGTITGPQFAAVLDAIAVRQRDSGDAADRHTQGLSDMNQGASKATLALQEFNANLQKNAVNAEISSAQSAILKARQEDIQRSAKLAAQGMLGAGDQAANLARMYGFAADQAQFLIDEQKRIAGLAGAQAAKENRDAGALSRLRARDDVSNAKPASLAFLQSVKQHNEEATAAAKQQHEAELQLRLAQAKTGAERLAILKQELAGATDVLDRLRLQTEIASLQNTAGKERIKDANQTLSLEEKIRDSKEQQLKASLDAREAAIRDRQERRKEDREIAAAQRILADPSKSQFAAAARDQLDLIDVQRQQRLLDIQQKLATAGGTIAPNGRVLQSRPGAGALPSLPAAPGGLPALPVLPGAPSGGGGGVPIVNVRVLLDSRPIAAEVLVQLEHDHTQHIAAGGGL